MTPHRLHFLWITTFVLTLSLSLCAADGDAEWRKVKDAIEGLRDPQPPPQSREDALVMLKTGLVEFDATYAAALKAAPSNPARWEAALFESLVGNAREMAGVPPPAKKAISLDDILAAEDANPAIKAQASILNVMTTAEAVDVSDDTAPAWIARAEKHLKDYPTEQGNPIVERRLKEIKTAVEFVSKPLDWKFTAMDGREVDLAKLRGKVVLIDFWATWCTLCVAELPHVLKVYQELHPQGFEVVGVSLDSDKAEAEAFLKARGVEWPQYFDGKGWENEISSKYGIEALPVMWLVNKKGMVVNTNAMQNMEAKVAKLLAE